MLSAEEPSRRPYIMSPVAAKRSAGRNAVSLKHTGAETYALHSQTNMQHIWVVTGPAGCGKTTVAQGLANELRIPYIEGDDYHSRSNKEKMSNNVPLSDADRWDWLIQLREAAIKTLASNNAPSGVVLTCSALKHKYRDVMRVAAYDHPSVKIHFVYLRVDKDTLLQRLMQRKGHYMKSDMIRSQLESLEEPVSEWDAISIDCTGGQTEVQKRVSVAIRTKLGE